jgi:hypothetical protein
MPFFGAGVSPPTGKLPFRKSSIKLNETQYLQDYRNKKSQAEEKVLYDLW